MTDDHDLCPRCGEALEFDEVDIGVGVMRGNPGCPNCHWTPDAPDDDFVVHLLDNKEDA